MWVLVGVVCVVFGLTYIAVNFLLYCLSFTLKDRTRKKLGLKIIHIPSIVIVITGIIILYIDKNLGILP